MRARLAALEPERALAASRAAADRLLALPEFDDARGLLVFLSFGHEIDTGSVLERWLDAGRTLFVPRLLRPAAPLEVCRYPCPLETSSFGIRQPVAAARALAEEAIAGEVDAVVVPGLAFDRRCHRLGYGAGAFDRFLSDRGVLTVGFGFDLQVVDRVPVEDHDVRLDRVVTEARVLAT